VRVSTTSRTRFWCLFPLLYFFEMNSRVLFDISITIRGVARGESPGLRFDNQMCYKLALRDFILLQEKL
jgi:hypothetical protein